MRRLALVVIGASALMACQDMTQPTEIATIPPPNLDIAPTASTIWPVTTELGLQDAINNASPGDVIAVGAKILIEEGMGDAGWGYPAGILIRDKGGLTLVGMTPDAGLEFGPPPTGFTQWEAMVLIDGNSTVTIQDLDLKSEILSPGYTVGVFLYGWGSSLGTNLVVRNCELDFPGLDYGLWTAYGSEVSLTGNRFKAPAVVWPWYMETVEISNNVFECTGTEHSPLCLFPVGHQSRPLRNVTVSGNEFMASDAGWPMWIQSVEGSVRITQNTFFTREAGPGPSFNLSYARGAVITENTITGPFRTGVRLNGVDKSYLEGNQIVGLDGLGVEELGMELVGSSENLVRANEVSDAGIAGIYVNQGIDSPSCWNVFQGNRLGQKGEVAVYFGAGSCENTYIGNGKLVADDGTSNHITGHGSLTGGAHLGLGVRLLDMEILPPTPKGHNLP